MKFRESELAHRYLDGGRGIEIGASAHNPFNIDGCIFVDYCADTDTIFKREEVELCGEAQQVDVVSNGDVLPFRDECLDYVLSSHVIEHIFDPIKALTEWLRVLKPGGIVFCIAPHKWRTFDKRRRRTKLRELIARHEGRIPPPDQDLHGHYSVWVARDFLRLCKHMQLEVIDWERRDSKVGNGFTVVIRK